MCQWSTNPHLICLHVLLTPEQFCSDCRAIYKKQQQERMQPSRRQEVPFVNIRQEAEFVRSSPINYCKKWREDLKKWAEETQSKRDKHLLEVSIEGWSEEDKVKARAGIPVLTAENDKLKISTDRIESEEREQKNKILRKWTRIFQESFVKEETTDKVSEAQQFMKDYEKWLEEHPKKTPPKAMKDRYEEDRQFVLSQYRVF